MFEQALIFRAGDDKQVDIGLVAETLFFYGSTHLLLDRASVVSLVRKIHRSTLIELLDSKAVKATYVENSFGVLSSGMPKEHTFTAHKIGSQNRIFVDHREEILVALERELGASKETKKFAKQLADRVGVQRYRGIREKENIIPTLAREDAADASFIQNAIRICLTQMVPGFNPDTAFHFRLFNTSSGAFGVDTDLNFEKLNLEYHKVISPQHSILSPAYLLSHVLSSRADMFFAAYYMAEPVTSEISGSIAQIKHFEFLRRREIDSRDIDLFHEIVVPDVPTIRAAINSGERSMEEFLIFLGKAEKFKSMLRQGNPDVGLVQTYNKEVSKLSWVDTLPGKTVRFVVASAAGLAANVWAPGSGFAVGGINTFFLDRILKGWRPNQFIEGSYKNFFRGNHV